MTSRFKPLAALAFLALGCVAFLSLPAYSGPTSSCATATISAIPDHINVTWTTGIKSVVQNCSSTKKRYTIVQSHIAACGVEKEISRSRQVFVPNETKIFTSSYAIAPGTCLGPGRVTVRVYDGSALVVASSAPLTVE